MPIKWPARYAPERVAVRVSNEILIAAEPATVWAWLVRASLWPTWYPNSRRVKIAGGAADLSPGTTFTWRTFGAGVRSTVLEFEPPFRIAWDGAVLMGDVYHAWLITPRERGCHVLTEEHQNGLGPRLQALLMPQRMFNGHKLWLERLRAMAESGRRPE